MPRRKKNSHENQSRSSLSINKDKPQQRYAANARERARMRVLSRAFCRLKTTLPWVPADTKLSKLDTLRLAASYIAHLKGILRDETLGSSESSLHPAMSMTWPFGFNRPLGGSAGGGSQEGGSILGSEDDEDDDEEDIDDEDGESISSCTWEEVSPPSTKECVHLDTRSSSRGRARGKTSSCNTSSRQVNNKKETSSSPSPISNKHNTNLAKSEDFPSDNCNTNPTTTTIRPFSQTQHHHHQQHHHQQQEDPLQNEEGMYHHFEREIKSSNMSSMASHMMVVTNLENAPPHLVHSTVSPQNGDFVGVGNPNMSNATDSFLADINSASFTQLSHHINHGGSEMHHHAPSAPFAFGNSDLISIG